MARSPHASGAQAATGGKRLPKLPQAPPPPSPLRARLAESARYAWRTATLVHRSSPRLARGYLALVLAGSALPLAVAWVGKQLVDAVVARSEALALRWVLVELGLVVLMALAGRGAALVRQVLGARLGVDVNTAILEKASRLELAEFEDSELYDRMTRARREASSRPLALVSDAFSLVQNTLTLGGYLALLVGYGAWVAALLLLSTVPATLAEVKYSKEQFKLRNWRSPESRKLLYLEHALASDEHAKEVRLFDLAELFLARYKTLAEAFYAEDARLAVKKSSATTGLSLLATFALYGTYATVALLAARGSLSLGTMTLYVLAFRQGQAAFQAALSSLGSIYEHNLYMSNLFSFLGGEVDAAPREAAASEAAVTSRVAHTADERRGAVVRFEGVGFKYPGRDEWALRGIDLTLAAGERVALVGHNGAGKTTFVKLMTGLYAPTEGRVLVDGVDVLGGEGPDAAQVRRALLARFGVVFQDFNQYQLSLRENVGVGSVPRMDDEPHVRNAAALGGAGELVSSLEGGLEAPLGHWFRGGVELSGGQWQKIALSRAFMRDDADILVLDEPTAALDAESEHTVFERFHELAEGRTTLVISHRFPTVRMADRILVLEGGRVTEEGSHDALVARGGTYARLFALQAKGYQ
ncbi:MAG TPA: ABC transporter ATP-binding protein [Polyangiaceae bacterium]|nr:ABC transporter ATP-binding protein [Polyangiaceae bacterium]